MRFYFGRGSAYKSHTCFHPNKQVRVTSTLRTVPPLSRLNSSSFSKLQKLSLSLPTGLSICLSVYLPLGWAFWERQPRSNQ